MSVRKSLFVLAVAAAALPAAFAQSASVFVGGEAGWIDRPVSSTLTREAVRLELNYRTVMGGPVAPRDMGQMSSQQTSQGETGTPHTHGTAAAVPRGAGSLATRSSGLTPLDMGQMSSHGTPQGETGTPHQH